MRSQPLVSIGLPTYNRASLLPRALDSLLLQTYRNIEIIISDDASPDNTQKICEEYARKDPRIRYIRQKKTLRQLLNFQFVGKEARGKYFMLVADDDLWDPTCVEKLVRVLEENPEYGVVMSSVRRIYDDDSFKADYLYKGEEDVTPLNYYEVFYRTIAPGRMVYYFLYGLYRTELYRVFMHDPFPKCVRFDRVFMGEAALAMRFYSVPEVLFTKTESRKTMAERYKNEPTGKDYIKGSPWRHFPYMASVFSRVLISPCIPWTRKLRALAVTYPRFLAAMIPYMLYWNFPIIHSFFKRFNLKSSHT